MYYFEIAEKQDQFLPNQLNRGNRLPLDPHIWGEDFLSSLAGQFVQKGESDGVTREVEASAPWGALIPLSKGGTACKTKHEQLHWLMVQKLKCWRLGLGALP